ncbi:MAG: HAMP domain-containing protein [Candidatus Competibacterales bacterium]
MKIQTKILILTFVVTTTVLSGSAAYYVWQQNRGLSQELTVLTEAVADRFAAQAALALWNVDEVLINDSLLAEMSERRIASIVVRDEDMTSVYAGVARSADWQPQLSAEVVEPGPYYAQRPITYDGEEIGLVEVNLSDRFLTAQTQGIIQDAAIGVVILNVALLVSLFIALRFFIVNPLSKLKTDAEAIAEGNLTAQVSYKSQDEIGQVGQAIELMKTSLNIAMKRLQRA